MVWSTHSSQGVTEMMGTFRKKKTKGRQQDEMVTNPEYNGRPNEDRRSIDAHADWERSQSGPTVRHFLASHHTSMPASALQRHLEACREKTRERMARLRATRTEEQREKHREAQRQYRDKYREQIAHRARTAARKRNSELGKDTKLRPAAQQYWSDPEQASEDEDYND
ncbi:hypothetical protein B0H13DRAFT_1873967 [Mycena leptocephala]|nr:hypothetical protein B0H13DRAFT_1873967 [Mycena leptocephala]